MITSPLQLLPAISFACLITKYAAGGSIFPLPDPSAGKWTKSPKLTASFIHTRGPFCQRKGQFFQPYWHNTDGSFTSARKEPCHISRSCLGMDSSPLPSSSQRTSPSPWAPGKWKITLDFGREYDDLSSSSSSFEKSQSSAKKTENENDLLLSSLLGEEWGAGGGRLALSFQIEVNSDMSSEEDNSNLRQLKSAWLGGRPTGAVKCIPLDETKVNPETVENIENCCTTYINDKGQQFVDITSGHWRIDPPLPLPNFSNILPGQSSTLRFYLTMKTPIQRNSIYFPSNNQLFFLQSNVFRRDEYKSGIKTLLPYRNSKEFSQQKLEEQLNHETGDRRLDGNDVWETLEGYKDVAGLVMERDERYRKWKDVEGVLPFVGDSSKINFDAVLEDDAKWGIWPGDTELCTIERGVVLAAIKEKENKRNSLFSWAGMDGGGEEEIVVVGKWKAVPVFGSDNNN